MARLVYHHQIDEGVEKVANALAPDVVRIRYSIDDDWTGDESIFFRVVLSDEASRINRLREVSRRARAAIREVLKAEELGLNFYVTFRSLSETKELPEAAWD